MKLQIRSIPWTLFCSGLNQLAKLCNTGSTTWFNFSSAIGCFQVASKSVIAVRISEDFNRLYLGVEC